MDDESSRIQAREGYLDTLLGGGDPEVSASEAAQGVMQAEADRLADLGDVGFGRIQTRERVGDHLGRETQAFTVAVSDGKRKAAATYYLTLTDLQALRSDDERYDYVLARLRGLAAEMPPGERYDGVLMHDRAFV
jgi:hypothetical protein